MLLPSTRLVGTTSFPTDFAATLQRLQELHAATLVPGHGPVMHDDGYLQLEIRLLASIKQQAEAAVARGESLEQARQSVKLDEFRTLFAGDSKVRRDLFDTYVAGPGVARAYELAKSGD